MSSYFFCQVAKNQLNSKFIDSATEYAERTKKQIYLIDRPLGDSKYSYDYSKGALLLSPKHRLTFVNFSNDPNELAAFAEYVEEFLEDLGSISDKYRYKDTIGRPRTWRDKLTCSYDDLSNPKAGVVFDDNLLENYRDQRICELLISLLTGSINDIDRITIDKPESLLDQVKQKILLFDGDQTKFLYSSPKRSPVRIQGLSGTGKTELLLHKIKDLYVNEPSAKIAFTCHNKILADNLRKRIPDFFNFMKVEQQISWDERLWCVHAWGSQSNKNSGIYSYICRTYGIPFERFAYSTSFEDVCARALKALESRPAIEPCFDYLLIDESQDFTESFFQLCQLVTRHTVYIAGDIFQSIFDERIIQDSHPDHLLSKCYRTDPRTLMFAHAFGMGLFENNKLNWLGDDEWRHCGYIVNKRPETATYLLSREPLRRFEDIAQEGIDSVQIIKTEGRFLDNVASKIVTCIKNIKAAHPTATADDIGIILLDKSNSTYAIADELEILIPRVFGWEVNKAYETKSKTKESLFISNRNNVKGLEFPFIICASQRINNNYGYRNAIYMTLTRSFIQTYLIVAEEPNAAILQNIEHGLKVIMKDGHIETTEPTPAQKLAISTTIKWTDESLSFFDTVNQIFDELEVLPIFRDSLLDAMQKMFSGNFDYENLKDTIEFNYSKMRGE
jgi:superfamily I DNA and RNA helicase